jgi:hypothetical protein
MEQLKRDYSMDEQVIQQEYPAGGGLRSPRTEDVSGGASEAHGREHHGHRSCGRCRNCKCHTKRQQEAV